MSLDNLNYTDLLIAFRRLVPFQQAVVVGLIFFVIYALYAFVFLAAGPMEAVTMSLYPSIMFLVVYYFASVVILKKNMQANVQSRGPKKGLRNK